jgi:hypothetical protein
MSRYSSNLKDTSGNVCIIYAVANDGSYNQIYGISGDSYTIMYDTSNVPIIGYSENMYLYDSSGSIVDLSGINSRSNINIIIKSRD